MKLWGATDDEQSMVAALPVEKASSAYNGLRLQFVVKYPDQSVVLADLADASAAAGEHQKAIVALERAADAKEQLLPYMLRDPIFDALHANSRFVALRERLNLPPLADGK
jgi:hypothetical protein